MIQPPVALLAFLFGSSPDSIPLAQAREQLALGDTLAAIEVLHDWSADHEPTRELTDLLGLLHLPDESPEPPDTPAVVPPPKEKGRRWWVRGDHESLAGNDFSWSASASAATRVGEILARGVPIRIDGGLAAMAWSVLGDEPSLGAEAFASCRFPMGSFAMRLDAWAGILAKDWDAGVASTVSRPIGDSTPVQGRWGLDARYSALATSLVGGFVELEKGGSAWTWEARGDLRLRRDPVIDDKDAPDSLRFSIQGARAQVLARSLLLRRWGRLSLGPAIELDARSSLAEDRWKVGTDRVERLRRDGSLSAGLVGRIASSAGKWGEARIGWTEAMADSGIDPDFASRNSGLTSSLTLVSMF